MSRPRQADIAPVIRGHFLRAMRILEDKGKPLTELLAAELEKNPLATLKAIAAFPPRERNVTATVRAEQAPPWVESAEQTERWLEEVLVEHRKKGAEAH